MSVLYQKMWAEGQRTDRMLSMVRNLKDRSLRKSRLFAVACCRRVWEYYPSDIHRDLVVALEEYIEGRVRWKTVQAERKPVLQWGERSHRERVNGFEGTDPTVPIGDEDPITQHTYVRCPLHATEGDFFRFSRVARDSMIDRRRSSGDLDPEQCDWLRDIFGNPWRPVAFDTSWRTEPVVALARTMYEARDFAHMPILADALQDAGCEYPDILSHCRDPEQVHVRGCWVVDLVLGKA